MKKLIRITSIMFIMYTMSGCIFSYMSYKSSEKEILKERIISSGNEDAIRNLSMGVNEKKIIEAVSLSNNGMGLKINLVPGWTEIFSRNGMRQTGAAILDAGMLYGLYELSSNDSSSKNTTIYDSSQTWTMGDNNDIVSGDNNSSNNDNDGGVEGTDNDSNNDMDV